MAILTKEDILRSKDLPRRLIDVPEWQEGGQVYVRVMTGHERDAFMAMMTQAQEQHNGRFPNMAAVFAASTMCDEEGGRLFTIQEAEILGEKSFLALDRVAAAAQELNAVTPAEVEALAKNLNAPTASDDSGSVSLPSLGAEVSANGSALSIAGNLPNGLPGSSSSPGVAS